MSLCQLPIGTEVIITKLVGDNGVVKRLSELGFTMGTKMRIIRGQDLHGPVLVEIRDSRIMIGHDIASKIIVEEVE